MTDTFKQPRSPSSQIDAHLIITPARVGSEPGSNHRWRRESTPFHHKAMISIR
jgi:hypothetical protein